ncbi:RNA-binding 7 [Brachionus plicatilis]|uniref:RNA-binding 7 n=1 Tax=Brachionus plicatilis TaxID=10195 RepID=A0A3M7S439_BRAPC|nr:RNA-binding 7 [Brachionus plicatilis]
MTATSEDSTNPDGTHIGPKTNSQSKEQFIQSQKDRTLFCINIDQNCSEDILYELFLQVGPIDNIVRKADRNGNIIALITYKHIESCDYAIRLFNGIKLFNQSLKVQQSQPGGQITAKAGGPNTPTNPSYQNRYSRKSMESIQPGSEAQAQSLMGLMFMQQHPQNFQQFSAPQSYNRSHSIGESDAEYRTSRRSERHQEHYNHQQQQHGGRFQRNLSHHQRDHSHQERDFREHRRSFKRSRSKSPLSKRRR